MALRTSARIDAAITASNPGSNPGVEPLPPEGGWGGWVHALQEPPQSTPVSPPFCHPSVQDGVEHKLLGLQ